MLAAVVGLALVVGIAVGYHRWTHPSLFSGSSAGGIDAAPQPLAKSPIYVGFGSPATGTAHETITINDARVHFSSNTAGATGKLAVCTPHEAAGDTTGIGFTNADHPPEEFCAEFREVEPGTETASFDNAQSRYLVAVVEPTRPGTAKLDRIDLDYTRGWRHFRQHGTEQLRQDVTIRVE